ncbi:MAG: prepilin-type N-terminal cleavage/methylation domain-containing protein [Rickettsiales bacterium]|nr:prepilin-type N-terminal cleavage/methylation domain-containing protein [Rickettsiales bacterium]
MKTTTQQTNQAGFTLVELAIVLVIIGLIIGGVLVGQDLIRAAEIRSTITQIERYGTSANAFRDKYRYVPGDLPAQQATNFGFENRGGGEGAGDGNTLLEGGAANSNRLDGEIVLFWRDLYDAELIEDTFTAGTDAAQTAANPDAIKDYLPEAKIGRGNVITVFSDTGRNFWYMTGMTSILAGGAFTERDALAPEEAFNIDVKIDDGLPLTGGVRAYTDIDNGGGAGDNSVADTAAGPAAAGDCIDDALADDAYNTSTQDEALTPACQLRIRMN